MTRAQALEPLYADRRRRAEAMLPTLSLQEREDKLVELLENDVLPTVTEQDDPADVALGIYHSGEEGWENRLVRAEVPTDLDNPRYDKLIFQVLLWKISYYGVTNQYLSAELALFGHHYVVVSGKPGLLLLPLLRLPHPLTTR
jgi:hypothetical protein